VVTSPVIGPVVFLAVMWLVFLVATSVAAPIQGALDSLVSGPLSAGFRALFSAVGLGGSWVEGLLVYGLVAGIGMLLTFVPLIALMLALLALLEDSGYMALPDARHRPLTALLVPFTSCSARLTVYVLVVATLAAQKREIGLRWTVFGVAMQLTLAWSLAVAVFQVGRVLS